MTARIWLAVACLALGVTVLRSHQAPRMTPRLPSTAIGFFGPAIDGLPRVGSGLPTVTSPDVPGPMMIIVVDEDDCLSCLNLTTEAQILRRRYPRWKLKGVGVGSDTTLFRQFFDRARIPGYLDETGVFPTALSGGHTPLVLLLGSDSRILFVDARVGAATQSFPVSRVLEELGRALAPTLQPGPDH